MTKPYYYKKLEINQTYEEYIKGFILNGIEDEEIVEAYKEKFTKKHFEDYHKNDNYGVFASTDLEPGDLIDTCMYVGTDKEIMGTKFGEIYTYTMTHHPTYDYAIIGGVGMFFNNSKKPNVGYRHLMETRSFEYYAIAHIKQDEELFMDYNQGRMKIPLDQKRVFTHPKIIKTPVR